jgi:uncharacterized membrane protein
VIKKMTQQITIENKILMERARQALQGKWLLATGASFLYILIVIGTQQIPKVGGIISLIVSGPLILGLYTLILAISRNQNSNIEQLFQGFQNFVNAFITYLLVTIFTVLWLLLLIVPGVIAAFSYSMTFLILVDDPTIAPLDAIRKSKAMMQGNKWKLACLSFRFIGWWIVCALTLGIGLFWLLPYMTVSIAKFYDELKANDVPSLENRNF